MLRRMNLLNIIGNLINPSTHDAQTDGTQKTQLVDAAGNAVPTVLTESGRAIPVYQTDRTDNGYVHFHVENLTAGTYYFIIVDISDTENYNHTATGYAHAENFNIEVACDVNGDWKVEAAFIEDVSSTGSRFVVWDHWERNKDTGNFLDKAGDLFPIGPHLTSPKVTSHQSSITTDFRSNIPVPSTLDPSSADIYPGNGDVVLKVVVFGGTVKSLKFNFTYHSH